MKVAMAGKAAGQAGPAQTPEPSAGIRVEGLNKTFRRRGKHGNAVKAVDGVSLTVLPGELVVLLGPSGCGKTTLLRCVAGLETADSGRISVGGRAVYSSVDGVDVGPNQRQLSMIFQSYALWPHMTVFSNVAYPLRCRGVKRKAELTPRVERALSSVGLAGLGGEYPGTLSGGQQQRLALARALVTDPAVLLFDEPLSNVDAKVRHQLREEIKTMHQRVGFAALYVTHDQDEALSLATRIAVLDGGRMVQVGTPEEIYQQPATSYVAEFVGRANTLKAEVVEAAHGQVVVSSPVGQVPITVSDTWQRDESGYLVVRPEDVLCVVAEAADDGPSGIITSREFRGFGYDANVELHDGSQIRASCAKSEEAPQVGDRVKLNLDLSNVRFLRS